MALVVIHLQVLMSKAHMKSCAGNRHKDHVKHLHSILRACSVVSKSMRPHGLWPAMLLSPWDFPDKNTGVGFHFLLQGIFPNWGLNLCPLCLLHCRQIVYYSSHQGSIQWNPHISE